MSSLAVVQPESYEEQLTAKVAALKDMFREFSLPEVEVHRSQPIHYRVCCKAARVEQFAHRGVLTHDAALVQDEARAACPVHDLQKLAE